jgi:3-methyladenine DNA glycosylase AlkC
MDKLRDVFNEDFVERLTTAIKKDYTPFDSVQCHRLIFQEDWQDLALKQRMRRITISLYETLPKEYRKALSILYKVAPPFDGLSGIIFPDYVEQYGLIDWDESLRALETFTKYSTSEFAVRTFLLHDQEKMIARMIEWSKHPNEHVRRLASEGSRPRLPWGLSIPSLKLNPLPSLAILTNLKQDESLYVRKSVANHLNDISKTHPDLVLNIAKEWYGKNEKTNWIIKHACRTMLKNGDKDILSIFGYIDDESIQLHHFNCSSDRISIGDSLDFSFQVEATQNTKGRIEYAIDFVKPRGNRTKKVFKITETTFIKGENRTYSKSHSLKDLSTRKHYQGTHTISIIINGAVKASLDFIVE